MAIYLRKFSTPLGLMAFVADDLFIYKSYLPEKNFKNLEIKISCDFTQYEIKKVPLWLKSLESATIKYFKFGEKIPSYFERHINWNFFPDFQRRVLQATMSISHGNTLQYGEIALKIKKPGASRAVGTALGKNPIPLIIPCHRVLAKVKSAGGYSAYGGLKTKNFLLNLEAQSIRSR